MTDKTDDGSEEQAEHRDDASNGQAGGGGESDEGFGRRDSGEDGETEMFPAATDETASGVPEQDDDSLLTDRGTDEEQVAADERTDEAFEEMVDDVETEEVWTEVTDEESEGETLKKTEETAPPEGAADADIAEVSKHDYCESCEYFSEAPEIHCTHDGTEILEFVDMEHVRLSNCPIVAKRRGLEQGIAKGRTDLGEIQRE